MKKKIVTLCLVGAMALTAVGGTLAYFTDTQDVKNTFVMGDVKIKLDEADVSTENSEDRTEEGNAYTETFMPGVEFVKDPTVYNTGSEDAYLFLDISMNKYKSLFPVIAQDAEAAGLLPAGVFDACMAANNNNKFSTLTFLEKMMTEENAEAFRTIMERWFAGIEHADWKVEGFFYDVTAEGTVPQDGEDGDRMILRLAYIGDDDILAAGDEVKFMDKITVPETVTQEMMENKATGVNAFNVNGTNSDGSVADGWKLDFKAYAIQASELDTVDAAFEALFGTLTGADRWYE